MANWKKVQKFVAALLVGGVLCVSSAHAEGLDLTPVTGAATTTAAAVCAGAALCITAVMTWRSLKAAALATIAFFSRLFSH